MRDHFAFSTRGRLEAQAFEDYVALYAHGSDVTRGSGAFHAEMRAWRMHGLILFDRRLSGVVHSRNDRVKADAYDHFVLHAVLAGHLLGSPESGFEAALPGEMVLIDTLRPTRTEPREAHLLTISIARHLVTAASHAPAQLHGRVLGAPSNLVLLDYLRSLAHRAPDISDELAPVLSRILVDLLSAILNDNRHSAGEARRIEFGRRQAVERAIAARLGHAELGPEEICKAIGISRSSLYRLLQEQGGLGRLIRRRRLSAVRSALDNGSQATLAELAEAFGFGSESHLSRLFAQTFGQSITDYRRAASALAEDEARHGQHRWASWMSEVG